MSTTSPAPAALQTAVVAAIAVLHVGVFLAVMLGDRIRISLPELPLGPIVMTQPPTAPTAALRPDPVPLGDYQPDPVELPKVAFSRIDDGAGERPDGQVVRPAEGGSGPALPIPDYRGPALRVRDDRLQALIDGCYPASARRLPREGRGVLRVIVDTGGRAGRWSVDQSTGFAELDAAMGCIVRRLQFEPGRLDGRAVEATALMPVHFQLR